MKKILTRLLICLLAIVLVGCTNNSNSDTQSQGIGDDTVSVSDKTENNSSTAGKTEDKVSFADDQILFVANDRCDIEDDRSVTYAYNYKGELLDLPDMAVGFFAENGLAPAYSKATQKIGFVDKDGIFAIEPKYDDAAPFSKDGVALVKVYTDGFSYKCGYINDKGEEITPIIYDSATSFYNCGYALARLDGESEEDVSRPTSGSWGIGKEFIIDKTGKTVVEVNAAEDKHIFALCKDWFVLQEGGEDGDNFTIYDYSYNKLFELKQDEGNGISYIGFSNARRGVSKVYEMRAQGDGSSSQTADTYTYIFTESETKRVVEYTGEEEKFDGKKFVAVEKPKYDIFSLPVATTQSGYGTGIVAGGETVISFKYDRIYESGGYFVCEIQKSNSWEDTYLDIYDKDFNLCAENLKYSFVERTGEYGNNCELPNGYFQVRIPNDDYETVDGIIDYTGKVIVPTLFGRGITLYTYESVGVWDWDY